MTAQGQIVDHSARDRDEIQALLMRELQSRLPEWRPESTADLGVTLVELLAFEADRIAYEQDAAGTEAYIGTARRRTSVARHARLLGVGVGDGCNSRTWVHIEVEGAAVTVPGATMLFTSVLSEREKFRSRIDTAEAGELIAREDPVVFETMRSTVLHADRNHLQLHGDPHLTSELDRGAISAVFCGSIDLDADDVLAFVSADSEIGPQIVRLIASSRGRDESSGHSTTTVTWAHADALRAPISFRSQDHHDRCHSSASVLGNVVLADHGRTLTWDRDDSSAPKVVPSSDSGTAWHLALDDLTYQQPLDINSADSSSADVLHQDPFGARAVLELREVGSTTGNVWTATPDLLGAHRFAQRFVIEPSDVGGQGIRFGDGTHGRALRSDALFEVATVRVGCGPGGDVGAKALCHIAIDDQSDAEGPWRVLRVENIVPAVGGRHAESIEVLRRRVPQAWRQLEACVVPADHAREAALHPAVGSAHGRWTAQPGEIEVFVMAVSGEASEGLTKEIRRALESRRVVGHVVHVRPVVIVDLHIGLSVMLDARVAPATVEAEVRSVLGQGPTGLFSPGRFQMGAAVRESQVVSAVAAVAGVRAVTLTALGRNLPDDDPGGALVRAWEALRVLPASIDIKVVAAP